MNLNPYEPPSEKGERDEPRLPRLAGAILGGVFGFIVGLPALYPENWPLTGMSKKIAMDFTFMCSVLIGTLMGFKFFYRKRSDGNDT